MEDEEFSEGFYWAMIRENNAQLNSVSAKVLQNHLNVELLI